MAERKRGNRRVRRLLLAIAGTAVGSALLAAGGTWFERRHDTDLAAPQSGVSHRFQHEAPDDAPALRFVDVAAELGVDGVQGRGPRHRLLPEDTGSGIALADFDGDGDLDLFLPSFGTDANSDGSNLFYRNDGGRFTERALEAGLADPDGFAMGATAADFDADGDLDLYVTQDGPNRLFRNRGDATFDEVAAELGVDDPAWSVGAVWGDFDRDGRLDLYVVDYLDFRPEAAAFGGDDPNWQGVPFTLNPNAFDPLPNRLYRQLPDGRFEEIALLAGVSDPGGRGLGATAVDLDGDGWLDLYVANDVSPNALFHNLGDPDGLLFEDWSARTGTADPRGSMGIAVGALGSANELPEIFVSHWIAQENALYQPADGARLEYRDRVRDWRLGEVSTDRVGWGCGFLDVDLDGRLDLAVANGSTLEQGEPPTLVPQAAFLFWNAGERFYDLAALAGDAFATPRVARGLAVGDFDGDGDSDLAISTNRGRPLLLRNEQATGHPWLAIELAGLPAHRHGAKVVLEAGGRRQVRYWGADVSFASQHAPELIFGLGDAAGPATVEVSWIGAEPSRHGPLEADRRHVLTPP